MAQPPPPPPPSAPWTAPASPPPPPWAPPTPRPPRRRLWIYGLVGAVLVIIGLAVASGTLWVTKVKPPIDAANDYMRDITNGDFEAAFDRLCAAEKVDASPESLQRFTDQLLPFSRVTDYQVTPFDVHLDGNRARLDVDLNPDGNGSRGDVVRLELQKIGGEWRPCGGGFGFVST